MRTSSFLLLACAFAFLATMAGAYEPACQVSEPVAKLKCLTGCDFDEAYVQTQYQLTCNIAALAATGAQCVTDKELKAFSQTLQNNETAATQQLAMSYPAITAGAGPTAAPLQARNIQAGLRTVCGTTFNKAYAANMMALLRQSKAAAVIAAERASQSCLRDTAKTTAKDAQNNLDKLQRWIDTGFLTVQDEDRFCGLHQFPAQCR